MKKSLRLIALALTLATVLAIVPVFAVSAEEATQETIGNPSSGQTLVVEAESFTYTAKKADQESEWPPKNTDVITYLLKSDTSQSSSGVVFNSGAVGNTFSVNFDITVSGTYRVDFRYRDAQNYYCSLQTKVNGENLGAAFSTKGSTSTNYGIDKYIGIAEFQAGTPNTVSFEVTEAPSKFAFVPDRITITLMHENTPDGSLVYESESTPFVAIDSQDNTIESSNANDTWAWSMKLGTTGLTGPLSNDLAYFRSGGINGTINYKLDVENAGNYDLIWAFRPNVDSYCTVQILVNKKLCGEVTVKPDIEVQGTVNVNNVMRTVRFNDLPLNEKNTVTIKLVGAKDNEDMKKTGFGTDYIALVHRDAKTQVSLAGFTANLGGNIGLNFHMNMTDAVKADNAQVVFDVAGTPTTIPVADGIVSEHGIMFTCEVAAKQMTDNITVKVVTDTLGESNTFTYSVAKYATYIVKTGEPTFTADEIALAKAMLNYGTEAQKEFNYNTESYANAALEESDKTVAPVDAAAVSDFNKNVDGTVAGISSNGTSLVLESATTLRLYFDLEDGYTVDNFTFKLGSTVLTANVVDDTDNPLYGKVYVDIVGITARNYDKAYTVTVSDTAESSTMTVSASIYACLNAYISSNKTVACAAYWYSVAAEAYFNK